MRKWERGAVFAAFIAILNLTADSTPASADWLRGHRVMAQCELDASRVEWTFCDGYVTGVAESLKLGGAICPPGEMDPKNLAKITLEYMRAHEKVLHQVSFALAGRALKQAYPCEPKQH
jgi:hypothetical protein